MLLPIVGFLGLAVDYAMLDRAKSALDASNDEAVLSAVTEAILAVQNGGTSPNTALAITIAQTVGNNTFNADASRIRTVSAPNYSLTVTINGLVITAVGTYTAQSPNFFGGMFGYSASNVNGTASASFTMPKYINIYMVVDISQSMGIGANAASQAILVANTPDSCQFGCHVPDVTGQTVSDETLGHNAGATLRIDVVRQAVENMISDAYQSISGTSRINFAIYEMDSTLHTISTLQAASNYTSLTAAAASIDLGSTTSAGPGDSYQTVSYGGSGNTLAQLISQIPAGGDGTSASSPQTFVFIMTDGVNDYDVGLSGTCATNQSGASSTGHCTSVFDGSGSSSPCTTAKNNNINVGVIYTVYVPFPTDKKYEYLVAPFQTLDANGNLVSDQMATAMQACSGSTTGTGQTTANLYYAAESDQDILNAGQSLFIAATAQTALIQ